MTGTDDLRASATELATEWAEVARILLAHGTVPQTLQQIVDLSPASIDGCDEAAICDAEGVPVTTQSTSAVLSELAELQTFLGEGPCFDTLAGSDTVYVADLATSERWPEFGPRAAAAGMRSALAYRLFANGDTLGALQLYARFPDAFNATDRAQGLIFATHAGLALGHAQDQETERGKTDNLHHALTSREVIGQAQGIIMERERVTADEAFDLLRRASQRLNVKLRAVAQDIVDTGVLPGPAAEVVPDA